MAVPALLQWRCAGLVAGLAALLLSAAAGAADLRLQVLDADRAARAAEDALEPAPDQARLLVSVATPGLLLRQLYVRVDGGTLIHHQYSDEEGRALLMQGLHPLATVALADGDHTLKVEFIARHVDDKPGESRVRERADLAFTKTPGRARIGLEVREEGVTAMTRNGSIRMAAWSGPAAPIGTGDEVDARVAAWFAGAGRPVDAMSALGRLGTLAEVGQGVQASVLASWGLGPVTGTPDLQAALAGTFNEAAAALAQPPGNPAPLQALIASAPCQNPAESLCDRARLVLGFHYLRTYDGESASAAFRAVHMPGPYTTRALLGLGWALVAPRKLAGTDAVAMPARYDPQDAAQVRARMPLPHGEERKDAMLAALVPWSDLVGRDPMDPAEQEGELAIAWALESLGAFKQADQRRHQAVDTLEGVRAQLTDALVQAQDGRLATLVLAGNAETESGWDRTLAPVSDSDPTHYLRWLLTDDAFSAAARDLRDDHDLSRLLDGHAQRLDRLDDPRAAAARAQVAALRPEVAVAEVAARRRLGDTARPVLEALRHQTEGYLVEARFALARTYDRPDTEEVVK